MNLLGISFSTQFLYPAIAYSTHSNKFLSIWNAPSSADSQAPGAIAGRITDAVGAPSGSPISIGVSVGYQPTALAYGAGSGGRFLAAWPAYDSASNTWNFSAQLLDDNGVKVGGMINVSNPFVFTHNTVIHNTGGLMVSGAQAGALLVHDNNLFGNGTYDIKMNSDTGHQVLDAANNYWGAVQPGEIGGRVFDCNDDANSSCGDNQATMGEVIYDPPLTAPAQNAPAFVNSSNFMPVPVGLNQSGTVTLNFSRPMDTTQLPTLSFYDSRRGLLQNLPDANEAMLVVRDPSNNIWFGDGETTIGNSTWGLKRFDGQNWTTYSTANGLGTNYISALFATRSGDIWVSHSDSALVVLSRYSGGVWRKYSQADLPADFTMVYSIAEDKSGKIWFSSIDNTITSYDGITWKPYTVTDNPLLTNPATSAVGDGQGRVWFGHYSGLSMFDGLDWHTYTPGSGLPSATSWSINSLFLDSKGRVWFEMSGSNGTYVGLIEGDTWKFFGKGDSGYPFSDYTHVGFADNPDGNVWLAPLASSVTFNQVIAIYDGIRFTSQTSNITAPFVFDLKRSVFMAGNHNNPAKVLWGGDDYTFDAGSWLSPTSFQTSYFFNARIISGDYKIAASGVYGTDGIEGYIGGIPSFTVDYAGQVSEFSPPQAPLVKAGGKLGDASYFNAFWTISDPNSQVDGYRYAIGTSAGGTDVLYWTTLSQATIERSGLSMTAGVKYYVTVQAHNLFGLWGASGTNSFVAGQAMTLNIFLPALLR